MISAIVRPAHPIMDALRVQLNECRIKSREFTGVGFFTRIVVPERLAVVGLERVVLSGPRATIDGLDDGAGFVLFVENGMIDTLEGFTYVGPWPDRIEGFRLTALPAGSPTNLESLDAAHRESTQGEAT